MLAVGVYWIARSRRAMPAQCFMWTRGRGRLVARRWNVAAVSPGGDFGTSAGRNILLFYAQDPVIARLGCRRCQYLRGALSNSSAAHSAAV